MKGAPVIFILLTAFNFCNAQNILNKNISLEVNRQRLGATEHIGRDALIGGAIGFLSGMVGIGGGIFLSPLLNLMKWDTAKKIAATASFFILVNSISGIAGNYAQVTKLPPGVWIWIAAAIIGGIVGSTLGSKRFDSLTLRRVLALVLLFAGVKLMFV